MRSNKYERAIKCRARNRHREGEREMEREMMMMAMMMMRMKENETKNGNEEKLMNATWNYSTKNIYLLATLHACWAVSPAIAAAAQSTPIQRLT